MIIELTIFELSFAKDIASLIIMAWNQTGSPFLDQKADALTTHT